ncbi:MAG: transketolase C-terminal domain-containing protein [Novosphingobium sp.]
MPRTLLSIPARQRFRGFRRSKNQTQKRSINFYLWFRFWSFGGPGRSRVILTIEEHNDLGGLGSAVAEVLAENGNPARLVRHGIKDEYSLIGPPTHLYGHYKLDEPGIEDVVRAQL